MCACHVGFASGMCVYEYSYVYNGWQNASESARANCTIGLSTDPDVSPGSGNCEVFAECSSNPCQNQASCLDSNSDVTLEVDHYQCVCLHGYASGTGGNCGIDIDECGSSPCQNGAVCADSTTTNGSIAAGGYRCSCADGFASGSCDYSPIVPAVFVFTSIYGRW